MLQAAVTQYFQVIERFYKTKCNDRSLTLRLKTPQLPHLSHLLHFMNNTESG